MSLYLFSPLQVRKAEKGGRKEEDGGGGDMAIGPEEKTNLGSKRKGHFVMVTSPPPNSRLRPAPNRAPCLRSSPFLSSIVTRYRRKDHRAPAPSQQRAGHASDSKPSQEAPRRGGCHGAGVSHVCLLVFCFSLTLTRCLLGCRSLIILFSSLITLCLLIRKLDSTRLGSIRPRLSYDRIVARSLSLSLRTPAYA